jgi:excisionase family DNA binding protein
MLPSRTELILAPDEAAERLRVSRRYLLGLARKSEIGYVRLGPRKIAFRPEDIDGYIESHTRPAKPPVLNKHVDTNPRSLLLSRPGGEPTGIVKKSPSNIPFRERMKQWRS